MNIPWGKNHRFGLCNFQTAVKKKMRNDGGDTNWKNSTPLKTEKLRKFCFFLRFQKDILSSRTSIVSGETCMRSVIQKSPNHHVSSRLVGPNGTAKDRYQCFWLGLLRTIYIRIYSRYSGFGWDIFRTSLGIQVSGNFFRNNSSF